MDAREEADAFEGIVHTQGMRYIQRAFAVSALRLGVTSGTFLDIGTGPGMIPLDIAEMAPLVRVTGVDSAPPMIEIAQRTARQRGLEERAHFRVGDACELPFPSETFDAVTCIQVLHHFESPVEALREARRVLKPEGAALFADMVRPPGEIVKRLYVRVFGAEYDALQKRLYLDSLRAALTPKELASAVREAGFAQVAMRRCFITHAQAAVCSPRNEPLQSPLPAPENGMERLMRFLYVFR